MAANVDQPTAPPAALSSRRQRGRIAVVVGSILIAIIGLAFVIGFTGRDSASTRSVVATLHVPGHPEAILAASDGLWVELGGGPNTAIGSEPSLVRLNLATGAIDRTVRLGGAPGFAVRVGAAIWVGNSPGGHTAPGQLVELDWQTGAVLGRIGLTGPVGPVAYGDNSLWLTLSGDRPSDGATLLRIDPPTRAIVGQPIRISDRRSIGLAFADGAIWATAHEDGMLVRIDPATSAVAKVKVGNLPVGVAFAAGHLWVANRGDGTVDEVDPGTMQTVGAPIHVGTNPTWITAFAGSLWVANQDDGTVSRIDASSGQVVGPPIRVASPVAGNAAAHQLTDDGTSVWVASITAETVSRIDPTR